ncbi:alanine transaminase alt2 [Pyricularia oryzae]|nr:alanine transaminase alt2 [Pyricularia oryzae]
MSNFSFQLNSIALLITLTALLLSYKLLNSFVIRPLHNHLAARRLNCGSLPTEPSKWPLGIDTVLRGLQADRDQQMPDYVASRFAAMGRYTWRISVLGTSNIITAEPRNVQALLATQFDEFSMGDARTTNLKILLGRSIFSVDGAAWHGARETMRPLFARDNVSNVELLEGNFQKLLRCIKQELHKDAEGRLWTAPTSLAALLPSFTLDSASEAFLGSSAGALDARLDGSAQPHLLWALERMAPLLRVRFALRGLYFLYGTRELRRCADAMHAFVDAAMTRADDALKQDHDGQQLGGKRFAFLQKLRARCADRAEVREQVLGLLAAGTDTTAALVGWVFYSLIRHPRVFARLREAVLEDFGATGRQVTFERLKSCRYLQQVLSETLRRHSVVPLNSRRARRDTTLPTGGGADGTQRVFVPAGTEVNFSTHVLHRRGGLWGRDSDEFRPERWAERRPGVFHYVPFNGGPRICIGQQFALTEAGFVVVRMLQEFDAVEGLHVDPERDWHNFGITCSPGSPEDRHAGVTCRLRLAS